MTDPLDILFENLLEHLDENLPGTCWPLYQRESRLENALLASLTPEQIELLESYQAAAWRCTEQEERFLFRSGFRLAPGAVTPSRRASSPLTRPSFWPRSFCWMWSWPAALEAVSFLAAGFFAAVLAAAGFLAALFFAAVLAVSAFFAAAVRLAGFFSAVSSAAAAGSAPSALSAAFFLG